MSLSPAFARMFPDDRYTNAQEVSREMLWIVKLKRYVQIPTGYINVLRDTYEPYIVGVL